MQDFWEERYGAAAYAYGKQPNTFLETEIRKLNPGHALFPAEGEGRNAVFAARTGWSVEAFDYSNAGRKKALALAKSFDVNINYQVATIESFPFEQKQYDLIALFFVHLPPEFRRQLHSSCVNALRPGGKLLLEGFHTSQLGLNSGGPKAINMLFSLPDLEEDFTALKIDLITQQSVILNKGAYHNGPAETVRIIATK